jgi:Tfp pilus assembly protein PilE
MEQFFQDNHTYVGSDAAGGPCAADTSSSRYFTFSCPAANLTASTYTIQALGGNAATGDQSMANFTYTVDQSNTKNSTTPWGNNSCWVTKKGAGC